MDWVTWQKFLNVSTCPLIHHPISSPGHLPLTFIAVFLSLTCSGLQLNVCANGSSLIAGQTRGWGRRRGGVPRKRGSNSISASLSKAAAGTAALGSFSRCQQFRWVCRAMKGSRVAAPCSLPHSLTPSLTPLLASFSPSTAVAVLPCL